jgi:hypothetical protein
MYMWLIMSMLFISQKIETPHNILKFKCRGCYCSRSRLEVSFDHAKKSFSLEEQNSGAICLNYHEHSWDGISGAQNEVGNIPTIQRPLSLPHRW